MTQETKTQETKDRATELMQQELINKITEEHNTQKLAQLLTTLSGEEIPYYIFIDFLKKALEEQGATEEEKKYFFENHNRRCHNILWKGWI